MLRGQLNIVILSFIMLAFGACVQSEEITQQKKEMERTEETAIEDLEKVEHYKSGELAHILEREMNRKGQAVGYHYNQLPTRKGEIITGTETEVKEYGIYQAQVIVSEVEKTY